MKSQDNNLNTVLGILLGKFDTEEDAFAFLVKSSSAFYEDCTILKIYNNANPSLSIQQFNNRVLAQSQAQTQTQSQINSLNNQ